MINFPNRPLKLAIVQQPPAYLDLASSLELAAQYIKEAKAEDAELIVFGETWFCGYPAWIDHIPSIALWNYTPTKEIYAQMLKNGIEIGGAGFKTLAALAKQHSMYIVAGVNEVVSKGYGNGTLFNSLLFFDKQGQLVNHHRKLMPTYTEKLLYGTGDGQGLKTISTDFGPLGGLICWEHWMPLSRQAMHLENEFIHIAVWPAVIELHQLASRHYAFEGRCFVVAAGQVLRVKDLPSQLPLPDHLKNNPNKFLLNGGSSVIAPNNAYILEPQYDQEALIFVSIENWEEVLKERITLDVSGHYARPDVFEFGVNRKRLG